MVSRVQHRTTGKIVMGIGGPMVVGPADTIIEEMEEAEGADAVALAEEAIAADPGCIEARLTLAEAASDLGERIEHLDFATRTGEALWGPVIDRMGARVALGHIVGARPYLRAIEELGEAYAEIGEIDSAMDCFEILVRMDPRRAAREMLEQAVGPRI